VRSIHDGWCSDGCLAPILSLRLIDKDYALVPAIAKNKKNVKSLVTRKTFKRLWPVSDTSDVPSKVATHNTFNGIDRNGSLWNVNNLNRRTNLCSEVKQLMQMFH
jgi:hypothetical protein